ncbi:efflux RND transporter periplasmic adaptor subunit [Oceanimonas sp. CHS3-5]|uniref:efflux RND transporter periplasmic adaptor subunit n=1 Tax=Oceanimonas sp. CHS3-5 TaxID=3068186 RepID=UPI00273DA8AD|nr:efflux RND transporter periplasmic adaptor subunit [Oceanimonas sp. CHS3-5]MDP5292314.1 efflux RND transporter periplasmic adaptor subunit [Oceanimonas sp. CHS3-5]
MKKNHYSLMASICLLLFSSLAAAQQGPVVSAVTVTEQRLPARLQLVGTLKANQRVAIAPQVGARVTEVHFVPGQQVEKDQLLLSLDDRAARADVNEARAALRDARRILANYQALFKRKAVTQTELEGQQAAVAVAEARLLAARVEADYLSLKAPFAGVMGLTDVAPGSLLGANDEVAELFDSSRLKLDLAVPEKHFLKLRVGDNLQATTEAYGDRLFTGRLAVVAPAVDPDTLNARVRLEFDNSDGALVPGMLMRVQLTLDNGASLAVPASSLLYAGNQRYVFVVDESGMVSRRSVTVGRNLGDWIQISQGLSAGERVVSEGVVKLRDGIRVEVADEAL